MFLQQQVICRVAKGIKDDVDVAVEAAHVSYLFQLITVIINLEPADQGSPGKTAVTRKW